MIRRIALILLFCIATVLQGGNLRTIRTSSGGRVKTLDPALADDLASRNLVGALFDTLLEYDYLARPYRLKPAMLARMPEANADFTRYDFVLRDDLVFADDEQDPAPVSARTLTSRDVAYSFLRIADARVHSPMFWIFRSKIKGINAFHEASKSLAPEDESLYEKGVEGIVIADERRFSIILERPDPRFLYLLAMPNAGIVSRRAVKKYGENFARHPVGSGAFRLENWIADYRIDLVRNPDYRREFFPGAESVADRERPLPLADRIEIKLIKQPMTSWLLFLQGNLDVNALDKDNFDLAAAGGGDLSPVLKARGIQLKRVPEFEIRYVGFDFSDPRLGQNAALRKALSLAYNVQRRCEHFSHQMIPAQTVIPPGVAGFEENFVNEWCADDTQKAKKMLAEAGFPGGVDPATGNALHLTFDQSGNSSAYRQIGELAVTDFREIGVETTPVLNNNARFYEKLRRHKVQLFRLSWVGDYPDAENFLQLFYSGNRDSCNRTGFSDPVYDQMYEEILPMPDSPERTAKYCKMARYLAEKCPWILEGFPISWLLCHGWLENYVPGDFNFNFYKYLSVDPAKREAAKAAFRPLSMKELQRR